MKNTLFSKNLISIDDVSLEDLKQIFSRTEVMKQLTIQKGGDDRLKGKILAALFFEPSTRTFSSFITAMQRLGGGIIPLNGMKNTSIEKGESYQHTVQVFSRYADLLVIRHPEVGMPKLATQYIDKPVINAGDGIGEHPTQALFDAFTMLERFKSLDNLSVTLVGDLKNGRTVHSLAKLLVKISSNLILNLVAPEKLSFPDAMLKPLKNKLKKIYETDSLADKISTTDVLYITRVQKERFSDLQEYDRLKSYYRVDKKLLMKAKKEMIIMHPLPIAAEEITSQIDTDRRAVYLKNQLSNGLYLRMALLDLILNK